MKTEQDMQKEFNVLEAGLLVSKLDLDTELCQQSKKLNEAGQHYAEAINRRDTLKYFLAAIDNKIKTVYASTNLEIREELKRRGEKSTEDQIKAMVIVSDDVQKVEKERYGVEDEYVNACMWCAKWENLKDAYNSRGPDIRQLGSLVIAGYYSVDSIKTK